MEPGTQPNDPQPDESTGLLRLTAVLAGIILFLLILRDFEPPLGPYDPAIAAARPAVLWDWLELLIIPAALAAGAILFNRAQKAAENRRVAEAREQEQRIADDRRRQTRVEAYYDRMTGLLFNDHVREQRETRTGERAAVKSSASNVARIITVAVLSDLDPPRKGEIVRFLIGIGALKKDNALFVPLRGLDLSGAHLTGLHLALGDLSGANLTGADLSQADLFSATGYDVDLSGANLTRANLHGITLERANLRGANLAGIAPTFYDLFGSFDVDRQWTDLERANLNEANLSAADLSGAFLHEARLERANLAGAVLLRANLSGAKLNNADLSRANLIRTNLAGADLSGANLTAADLSDSGLSEAKLAFANLTGTKLNRAKLYSVDLKGANLAAADLSDTRLDGAVLEGALYTADTRWPAGFDPAAAGAELADEG